MKRYEPFITEEDRMTLQTIREFVDKEIIPIRSKLDEPEKGEHLFWEIMEGLVHIGMQKRSLPKEIGGLGVFSMVSQCTANEELARGDAMFGIAPGICSWVFGPAIRSRNMAVLQELTAPFCEDKVHIAAMGATEESGGCNMASVEERDRTIQTIAKLEGDGWVINGKKRWTSNGGVAEVYCVICQTDPALGEEGAAIIYVPAGTPGMSFSKKEPLMGLKVDTNTEVFLDDVRVPRRYRASEQPGGDARNLRGISSFARLPTGAALVGMCQFTFDYVMEYTGNRFYGGKQVRQHTMQAAILADMAIGIMSSRAFYLHVASMFGNRKAFGSPIGDYLMGMSSAARILAADAAIMVHNSAMDLMGAYGYSEGYPIAKNYRDFKILQIWEGGTHQSRIDVARAFYPVHGPELIHK